MAVVCTTVVIRLSTQQLSSLKNSCFLYIKRKKVRRARDMGAFNHVVLKKPHSNITYLIYGNGKCVVLSARSPHEIMRATRWICRKTGSHLLSLPVVHNIVYVKKVTLPTMPDILTRLYEVITKTHTASLELELSPALIVESQTCSKTKIMIFCTGKINITGISDFEALPNVLSEVDTLLKFT